MVTNQTRCTNYPNFFFLFFSLCSFPLLGHLLSVLSKFLLTRSLNKKCVVQIIGSPRIQFALAKHSPTNHHQLTSLWSCVKPCYNGERISIAPRQHILTLTFRFSIRWLITAPLRKLSNYRRSTGVIIAQFFLGNLPGTVQLGALMRI